MVDEMASFHKNEAWDLVELPTRRKPIGSKWVFKKRTNAERKDWLFRVDVAQTQWTTYICVSLVLCVFCVYISALFHVFHCSVIYNFLTTWSLVVSRSAENKKGIIEKQIKIQIKEEQDKQGKATNIIIKGLRDYGENERTNILARDFLKDQLK